MHNFLLDDTVFTFLDFETTGLNPHFGDRICEIALLKWCKGKEIDSFQSLVNPAYPISPGASAINGISDEMVKNAPYFKDLVKQILDFINGTVIVCHNARFDLSFLGVQLRNLGLTGLKNFVVDTLILARRYYCFPSNCLGNIAQSLGINVFQEHRAFVDTHLTKKIFEFFLEDFSRKRNVQTLTDLLKLQSEIISFPEVKEMSLPPAIEEAIGSGKKLKIKYISSTGEETIRIIEPIEVMPKEDYLYLRAWCNLRQEQRTFRFDRIIEMKLNE